MTKCECCGVELTDREKLDHINAIMMQIDEGMLFGMEDDEIKKGIHFAIELSTTIEMQKIIDEENLLNETVGKA